MRGREGDQPWTGESELPISFFFFKKKKKSTDAYGKCGITAVIRAADAIEHEWIMIKSSVKKVYQNPSVISTSS